MLDQLFSRSDALTRQLSAPLVDERRQYLGQCAAQGMLIVEIPDDQKDGSRAERYWQDKAKG
jgi:hypothetical protein